MSANKCLVAFAALFVAMALPVSAEFAVGAKVGTIGVGAQLAFGTDVFQGRLVAATFDYDDIEINTENVDYDGTAELTNFLTTLDWYPGGSGFRISVGLMFNDNRIVGRASVRQLLIDALGFIPPEVNGLSLGTLEATAEGEDIAPYVGIGFGNPLGGRSQWQLDVDLGVAYWGEPEVTLELRDSDILDLVSLVPGGDQLIADALEEERQNLEEEVEEYTWYPVVAVGLSYRF
ncbi:MAG: hypothetical protein AAGD38_03930 [Acidobacteriota bacterium]